MLSQKQATIVLSGYYGVLGLIIVTCAVLRPENIERIAGGAALAAFAGFIMHPILRSDLPPQTRMVLGLLAAVLCIAGVTFIMR